MTTIRRSTQPQQDQSRYHRSGRRARPALQRPTLAALGLAATLFAATGTASAQLAWTPDVTITELESAAGGFAWVGLNRNITCSRLGGASLTTARVHFNPGAQPGVVNYTPEGAELVYRSTLAAFLAGRTVRFRLIAHPTEDWCVVERISLR